MESDHIHICPVTGWCPNCGCVLCHDYGKDVPFSNGAVKPLRSEMEISQLTAFLPQNTCRRPKTRARCPYKLQVFCLGAQKMSQAIAKNRQLEAHWNARSDSVFIKLLYFSGLENFLKNKTIF